MSQTTNKFDHNVAPWLRLLTPIMMVLAMFILNRMNSNISDMAAEIKKVGQEQARRTVIVEDAYNHARDWRIHERKK